MVAVSSAEFTKYSVNEPWGSISTSRIVLLARASAAASETATVVFPIPPFWLAIAMICMGILSPIKIASQ